MGLIIILVGLVISALLENKFLTFIFAITLRLYCVAKKPNGNKLSDSSIYKMISKMINPSNKK
ncbi:MAG: hypothetical protein ACRCZR_08435 [Cetobacterium sp.]